MRRARTLLLLTLAACSGRDDKPAGDAVTAPSGPIVEGRAVSEWAADLAALEKAGVSPADAAGRRGRAAAALARAAATTPAAMRALLDSAADTRSDVHDAALAALATVGEAAVAPAAADLVADGPTSRGAGEALVRIGPAGLRRLVALLGDPAPAAPRNAWTALQGAGRAAAPALLDGMRFGAPVVRGAAARRLFEMGDAETLIQALADPSAHDAALDSLAKMGRDAQPALRAAPNDAKTAADVSALLARLTAGNHAAAVRALGDPAIRARARADLLDAGDAALPALVAGLDSADDAVRGACAEILKPRAKLVVKDAAKLLSSTRPAARAAAVDLLLRADEPGEDALIAALDGESATTREAVVAALRARGADALPTLESILERGSAPARAAVRPLLAALGAAAVPSLERAAERGNAATRDAACDALAALGAPSLPALRGLMDSIDENVRNAAADAAARIGPPAAAMLVQALGAASEGTSVSAARGLASMGSAAAPALVAAMHGTDAALAARSAEVVGALGAGALPELTKLAASHEASMRAFAVRALGRVARDADDAVPPLVAALADADASVRVEAARGLAAAGRRAKSAAKELEAALRDRSPLVRVEAATAFLRVGGAAAPAMAALASAQQEKDAGVRRAAADALGRAGLGKDQATPRLLEAMKDADVSVRRAAIDALVAVGADGPAVVEALAKSARASDETERTAAAAALPKLTDTPMAELMRVGGPFRGDRVQRKRAPGSDRSVEGAVSMALDWLVRHQAPDGRWSCAHFDAQCRLNRCDGPGYPQFDVGVTGLSLLAFTGAGESRAAGPHKAAVDRAIQYLRKVQDSDGCLDVRDHDHFAYCHAIATLALCDEFMMSGDPETAHAAQAAVGFVMKSKNPYLAWRYSFPPDGDNDTSVTAWMSLAVATADAAHLDVDRSALKDAVAWVDKMTEPEFGRTGYQQRGGPPSRTNETASKFPADQSESLTAAAMTIRFLAGHAPKEDEFLGKGADLCLKKLPKWDIDKGVIDFYYWFWGSTAMRQVGGDAWKKWSDALKPAVVAHQRAEHDRDETGSWDSMDAWSDVGGRIYATSMCCLALESHWRMDPLVPGTK